MATINGNSGNNNITGTNNSDTLNGRGGNDTLTGRGGNDVIAGGTGRDRLFGNTGSDVLRGDSFNDTLVGGSGNDTLRGGAGADIYVFNSPEQGIDVIQDFSPGGGDRIQISAEGFGIELNDSGVPITNDFAYIGDYFNGTLYFGDARLADLQSNFNASGRFDLVDYLVFV